MFIKLSAQTVFLKIYSDINVMVEKQPLALYPANALLKCINISKFPSHKGVQHAYYEHHFQPISTIYHH